MLDDVTTLFTEVFDPELCWQVLFFQVPGSTQELTFLN